MNRNLTKELTQLIGAKVVDVKGITLYFDNGMSVEMHPYETFVYGEAADE